MSVRRPAGEAAAAPEETPPGAGGEWWVLSFDCATKSFAYALLRLRSPARALEGLPPPAAALAAWLRSPPPRPPPPPGGDAELGAALRAAFHLAAGGAADLAPGQPDAAVPTVARIRALQAYLRGPVRAALAAARAEGCPAPESPALHVAVEYQMGANARARTVAAALVAEYSAASVCLVGPSLKNRVAFPGRPDLAHARFVEKAGTPYAANKNHTKAVYLGYLAPLYGHRRPEALARRHEADFSDSVMQALGLLGWGDLAAAGGRY